LPETVLDYDDTFDPGDFDDSPGLFDDEDYDDEFYDDDYPELAAEPSTPGLFYLLLMGT